MALNRGAGAGQPSMNINPSAGRAQAGQQAAAPGQVQQPAGQQPAAQQAGQAARLSGGYAQQAAQPGAPRRSASAAKPARQSGSSGQGQGGNGTPTGSGKPGGSRRTVLMVAGVVVAALVIWLLVWLFACNGNSLLDATAQDGQAPYKTEAEMQAELDRVVEEGMFNISIQSTILFEDGTASGTANIENVPGNHYNMQVSITDDDTGDLLYESGVLKPNQFIEKITLAKDLDPGTYNATATFTALDETTFEEVGQAAAKVAINVVD